MEDSKEKEEKEDKFTELTKDFEINKKQYFQLLRDKKISSANREWDQILPKIIDDQRYRLVTKHENRKQHFYDYLEMCKIEEEIEKTQREKQIRGEFWQMLSENEKISHDWKFHDFESLFGRDERWIRVEEMKDSLLLDFLIEEFFSSRDRLRKEKEEKRRKENKKKFLELLKTANVLPNSQWRKVKEILEKNEIYWELEEFERLKLFEKYVKKLNNIEIQTFRPLKEIERKNHRLLRSRFRELLEEKQQENLFNYKTSWKDFSERIKNDLRFQALYRVDRVSPREIFGDYKEEMENEFRSNSARLKEHLKDQNFSISENNLGEYLIIVNSNEEFSSISSANKKIFFDREVKKLKKNRSRKEKKDKKIFEFFYSLIKKEENLDKENQLIDFDQFICKYSNELANFKKFNQLGDQAKRKLFDDFQKNGEKIVQKSEKMRKEKKQKREKRKERDNFDNIVVKKKKLVEETL